MLTNEEIRLVFLSTYVETRYEYIAKENENTETKMTIKSHDIGRFFLPRSNALR